MHNQSHPVILHKTLTVRIGAGSVQRGAIGCGWRDQNPGTQSRAAPGAAAAAGDQYDEQAVPGDFTWEPEDQAQRHSIGN